MNTNAAVNYATSDAINYSTLKLMKRSPAAYRHAVDHGREDKPAFAFGRAVHLAVFEPERFPSEVVCFEGERRAGNVWKAFAEEHASRIIMKVDEFEECLALARAVRKDPDAAKYLASGCAEVAVEWTDDATGMRCKGRIDYVSSLGAILDLKTTTDASVDGFGRQAHRYDYALQAAMYRAGWASVNQGALLPFKWIAVEKTAPYAVQVYNAPEDVLELGHEECVELLGRVAECRRTGVWHGYALGETDLVLPRWAFGFDDNGLEDLGLDFGGES